MLFKFSSLNTNINGHLLLIWLHNNVNERIKHAFVTSGMLPSHYARFGNAAGIGIINTGKRDQFFKKLQITRRREK